MRHLHTVMLLAAFTLLATAGGAAHGEVYRTVDEYGVVTFTDVALPGAEPVLLEVPTPDAETLAQARADAERLIERADERMAERRARQPQVPIERETIVYREVVTEGGFQQRGFFPPFGGHHHRPPPRPPYRWPRDDDRFSDERPRFAPPPFAEPAFRPPQPVPRAPRPATVRYAKGL